jgi:hypothetical protein
VSLVVDGNLEQKPEACHCVQCRKQTGNLMMDVNIRKDCLTVRGDEYVAWYRSSENVERGFCSVCGSTLFWKPDLPGYEWIGVALGLFDEPCGAKIAKHTFVGDKGDYYDILDGMPQSDGY